MLSQWSLFLSGNPDNDKHDGYYDLVLGKGLGLLTIIQLNGSEWNSLIWFSNHLL